MNRETLFVVRYKGTWGNDGVMEAIVESHEDFLKWLEIHNKERADMQDLDIYDDNFCYENEEEFDLIPLEFFKS